MNATSLTRNEAHSDEALHVISAARRQGKHEFADSLFSSSRAGMPTDSELEAELGRQAVEQRRNVEVVGRADNSTA